MNRENRKITFSYTTIKGKDKLINTDKVSGFTDTDKAVVVLVDPSTGNQWGENLASLISGTINDSIKELIEGIQLDDITQLEDTIKNLIKDKIKEAASSLPNSSTATISELSLHLAILVWINNNILIFAAGKTSVYKVENHQLKAIYLLMDKPPIKLSPTGELVKFSLSINSVRESEHLSSIVVTSDGFYTFLKNPKIHNLLAKVESPQSVLSKLEEYLKNHVPDDNATIIMVWREAKSENIPIDEIPTLNTTHTFINTVADTPSNDFSSTRDSYHNNYNKDTVEKLKETLRNIHETEIGKRLSQRNSKKKKTSKLLSQPREKREISPLVALLIVLLFIVLFGGFLYVQYGEHIKSLFTQNYTQENSYQNNQNNQINPNKETATTETSSHEKEEKSQTASTQEISSGTTTNQNSVTPTVSENESQQVTQEPNTPSTTQPTEYKKILAISKPSGLRITLIQTDNRGRQIKTLDSCQAPCTIKVPLTISNPMVVAMYQGAICASYPSVNPNGWSTEIFKSRIILDCRYIAVDDPQKPILITTNPSNIRIKIFDSKAKEIFSALSPTRIAVLGEKTEEITIKAFIKGKQCAAYKNNWSNILKKKHIHLICQQ